MKIVPFLVFLLCGMSVFGQYNFSGHVSKENEENTIYLSLVEDYRKTSRVYLEQIISKTKVDSLGFFNFIGDNLITDNRIYRIHLDGCSNDSISNKHFLRDCQNSQSILFIAKGNDSIRFPLIKNSQPFCEIETSNEKSGLVMDFEQMKENMILDFMDNNSNASESLNFGKWFTILQEFGKKADEPLVELLIYDFLSDRKNETHAHYLTDLESNTYYTELWIRLLEKYPKASFTKQYQNELRADKLVISKELKDGESFPISYLAYVLLGFLTLQTGYYILKNRKRKVEKLAPRVLTPQELKIFNAIREGKTNKEIASSFFISVSTVKTHINSIYKKLDLESRRDIE